MIYQWCRDRFIFDIGVAAATAVAVIELLGRQQLIGGRGHRNIVQSADFPSCSSGI